MILLRRIFYIGMYALYQCYCFFARPQVAGVQIIVRHKNTYLLVRHTYRNFFEYDFVGGRKDRGETFDHAAARELKEETAVATPLTLVLEQEMLYDKWKHILFNLYETESDSQEVALDQGEIKEGIWLTRDEVEEKLSPFSRQAWKLYLKKKGW